MQSLTHAQGIFHIDVTDNKCMSVGGVSKNAQDFTENQTIDVMNAIAAKYIPDPAEKADYLRTFCRDALLKAFDNSDVQIDREYRLFYDDNSLRYTRISARLSSNPAYCKAAGYPEAVRYAPGTVQQVTEPPAQTPVTRH